MRNNKNTTDNKKSHKKIWKFILIIIIFLIIYFAIKLGIYVASWQNIAQNMIKNEPSTLYDISGEKITEIKSNKIAKHINYNDIPSNLINAYISIEDQRFFIHHGVDFPRTAAAILSYIKNMGSSSFGGSSITQQLVKNITGDNSSKVSRKLNEWIKALALENILSKEEILEAYLNIIYVGPNMYGVEIGSEYYFNKKATDLSLAECCFLAGINNSPNSYNPYDKENDHTEKITKRALTVLNKMLELGYIDENQFTDAKLEIEKGYKFKKGKIDKDKDKEKTIYDYHTDALISEVINDLQEKKNMSESYATNYLETAGLNIYSTQDIKIQKTIEQEVSKSKYLLHSKSNYKVTSQAAMIVLDHTTGNVLGCIGGLGKKTESRCFNRATQAYRQTGSAGKPIAVLLPALDKKIITNASMYLDEQTTFDDGTEEGYNPTDYNDYKGNITVRAAVETSQNIPFVRIMEELTPKASINYMKKLGITSLTKNDENLNLALGGLDKGISPIEMAAAYATIANDGKYIEPTFYLKIENSKGNIIIKSTQKTSTVFSKELAYVLKNLLTQPVKGLHGTAQYCNINNIDVAAKTGTTNNSYDRWLCGFTPYYTAVTWFGFDKNERINFNNKNPSGHIWSSVMKTIHSDKKSAKFEIPKNIEKYEICPNTGLLATTGCKNSYTEYFIKGTSPDISCYEHSGTIKTPVVESNVENDIIQDQNEEIHEDNVQVAPSQEIDNITSYNDDQNNDQNDTTTSDNNSSIINTEPVDITNNDQISDDIEFNNVEDDTSDSEYISDDTSFEQ